jgi:methionine-rich copper-binding protein CopC
MSKSNLKTSARGSLVTTVVVVLLAALTSVTWASPAAAHDRLIGTTPSENAILNTAPTTIMLTFNRDVLKAGSTIAVIDPTGSQVPMPATVVDGPRVSSTPPALTTRGTYTVKYRVIGSDGHALTGTFPFSIGVVTAISTTESVVADDHSHHVPLIVTGVAVAFVLGVMGVIVSRRRQSPASQGIRVQSGE